MSYYSPTTAITVTPAVNIGLAHIIKFYHFSKAETCNMDIYAMQIKYSFILYVLLTLYNNRYIFEVFLIYSGQNTT